MPMNWPLHEFLIIVSVSHADASNVDNYVGFMDRLEPYLLKKLIVCYSFQNSIQKFLKN